MRINNVILGQNLKKKLTFAIFSKVKKRKKHENQSKLQLFGVKFGFLLSQLEVRISFSHRSSAFNLSHFTWHLRKESYSLPNVSQVHQITEATERRTKESNHGMKSSENMMSYSLRHVHPFVLTGVAIVVDHRRILSYIFVNLALLSQLD